MLCVLIIMVTACGLPFGMQCCCIFRARRGDLLRAVQEKAGTFTAARTTHPPTHQPAAPALQDDLRRAVEEKVTALHLLASAERKLVEAQADESGGSSCAQYLPTFLCLPVGWVQLVANELLLLPFLCLAAAERKPSRRGGAVVQRKFVACVLWGHRTMSQVHALCCLATALLQKQHCEQLLFAHQLGQRFSMVACELSNLS